MNEVEAWADACRRLERLGEPGGVSHLVEQAICWLTWSVFHTDPRRPVFQRQNDLVTQWGGPNADNVYRHAPVVAGRRYRVRGRMHSCEDFILAVRAGFMHQPTWGTLHEVSASALGIGRGDAIDLVVGDGGAIPLPDGAATVSIREYYFDWSADEPATFTIECLDGDAGAPAAPHADLGRRIGEGVAAVEHSLAFWDRWLEERRAAQPANTFSAPYRQAKGLDAARYAYCFWDLGPGEALVVDGPIPDARYWSLQLYTLRWFELVDVMERQSSLNHTQAVVDGDGRVRAVVAHADPGAANWLDTGGRATGLLMLRWFWPDGEGLASVPRAAVVAHDDALSALPPGTATLDAAARAEVLRARRRHLAWRFRA